MHKPTIFATACAWVAHAAQHGARFNLDLKAATAITFTLNAGGSSFAIPSKLEGTRQTQRVVHRLVRMQQLHLHRNDETHRLECYTEDGERVGRIQSKHTSWLMPLVPTVRIYVTAITGRTQRTQGVNIVLTRIAPAIKQLHARPSNAQTAASHATA
ncbi:MAG: hypothetical protein AAGJ10_11965 [Bacteroidota bacterium]